jgi:hypothetical protein
MAKEKDTYIATPLNANRATIKQNLREWVYEYQTGLFILEGNNPINQNKLWPLGQSLLSRSGIFAFVRRAGDVFNLASVMNIVANDTGQIESIVVNYIPRLGTSVSGASQEELTNESEFVIALNTYSQKPDLSGTQDQINYIEAIFKAMVFDLECSRPRLFIKTHLYPTREQKERIQMNVDAYNMIVYTSLGDGKPMELHDWDPQSRIEKLKMAWDTQMSLFKEVNGLRYNVSKTENTERQPVKEIELVQEAFEPLENLKLQERVNFIKECYEKFGGEEYTLKLHGKVVFQIGDNFGVEEAGASSKTSEQPEQGSEEVAGKGTKTDQVQPEKVKKDNNESQPKLQSKKSSKKK